MHVLVSPRDATSWTAYHEIRRRVLFEARGRFGVYDASHPDETLPDNHAKLLLWRGSPIGVVRIDLVPPVAFLRRVAIREELQRRGHGRAMLSLAEDFAKAHGCRELRSHVDRGAIGFYRKLGFERAEDGADEPGATGSVFMRRVL